MSHPGTVTFVDVAEKSERTLSVSEVPDTIAWATVNGARVAVVKVVALTHGARRELQSFAADGRLLMTTYQHSTAR